MKTIKYFILLVFGIGFTYSSLAQNRGAITIFTKETDAKFRIFYNEIQQNNFYLDSVLINDLDTTMVKITLSFENESYADIEQEVYFRNNLNRIYVIERKNPMKRKIAKTGRKIGKAFKRGNHDKEAELEDMFTLKEITVYKKLTTD